MLSENDKQNLLRNLVRNRVTLVTGAGFSRDSKNKFGNFLPTGWELASMLWSFLYTTPYDGKTSLKTLYGAALKHPGGLAPLREFLCAHLSATYIPEWYTSVSKWFWYRVYSFNADDVMEKLFEQSQTGLDIVIAPSPFKERDQFLRKIQYIKLHGSVSSDQSLTFGPKEYGIRAASRTDMWYLHFVEDYSTLPTLFVGTELDEPIFWQYIEMRGEQAIRGDKVRRPKCFLVNPTISKPMEDMLSNYNIVPVRATAEAFFVWLEQQQQSQTREQTLGQVIEGMEPAILAAASGAAVRDVMRIEYFYSLFRTPFRPANPKRGSFFLLGAPPTWDDIANDVDAHREISDTVMLKLNEAFSKDVDDIILLSSAAGGGKSTISRRAALDLVDAGFPVYFSDGRSRPDPARIAEHILTLQERVFLFFDNAGDDLGLIASLWHQIRHHTFRPVILVAARSNDVAFRGHELMRTGARIAEVIVPNLSEKDTIAVLETLDRHDFLGVLKDRTPKQRVELFKTKARSQILVAMREATTGRGFDDILRDEFSRLDTKDAKLLYLVTAIASDLDYGLPIQQMISALDLPPNETLLLVEKGLNGILLQHENDSNAYFVRHPAIAFFIIQNAPREILADALVALAICITTILPGGREKRLSRAFKVYRRILSHTRMQTLFPNGSDLARSVYERLRDYCRGDGHYWLHFASFEIEQGGNISVAENYLAQADALLPNSKQVETATAHLLFKKAVHAVNAVTARAYCDEACKILRNHMLDSRSVSLHALHIFGTQMADYVNTWTPRDQRANEFHQIHRELERAIPGSMKSTPRLRQVLEELKRAELETIL